MGNVIKRNSVFIIGECLVDNTAFGEGEVVPFFRSDDRWITIDSNGKRWRSVVSHMRNENCYRFVEQYTISDIVYYMWDRNSDFQTVFTEILVDAIKETLNTVYCTSLEDVYKHISENLI